MEVPGPYYDGAKDVIVSLVYEGKHIQAKVVKINRPKTNRRRTAQRQPDDAHNVQLTLTWPTGTWDQEVEEEHLTLLDGSRFETKNYACDALPARRRKPAERLREDDEWQTRGLARGGKKRKPKQERLTPEAIDDLMLCYYKEPWCEWYIARDKDAETGKSRLAGQERDDYFYRSFGTGALEDLKWGQGNRVKKGIHIVRRSRDAVTLEGEDKPLVFRLSGEMHDGEPVYRFLAGNSQRKRARVAPPVLAPQPPPPAAPVAAPAAPPAAAPVQPAAPAASSPSPPPPAAKDDDELIFEEPDEDEDEDEALPQPLPQPKEIIDITMVSSDEEADDDDSSDEAAPEQPVRAQPQPVRARPPAVVPEAAAADVAELRRVVRMLDARGALKEQPLYFGATRLAGTKASEATRTHEDAARAIVSFYRKYRPVDATKPGTGTFTSVYISKNNDGRCHTDDGNVRLNSIVALDGRAPFTGGELELGIGPAAKSVDVRAFARGDGDPLFDFDATLPHRKLPSDGSRIAVVYYSHGPITMRGLSSRDRAYLVGLGFPLPPSEAEREAYDKRIHGKHLAGDRAATEAAEKRRLAAAYLAEAEALEARAEADRAA